MGFGLEGKGVRRLSFLKYLVIGSSLFSASILVTEGRNYSHRGPQNRVKCTHARDFKKSVFNPFFIIHSLKDAKHSVPDNKSRNIPEVVLVRRWAVGVRGIWRGGVGCV
jgi:hypothetical protein